MVVSAQARLTRAPDLACPEFVPSWLASAPKLIVGGTLEPVTLPTGMHYHSSYEFLIPLDPFTAWVGTSAGVVGYPMAQDLAFPLNSNQPHGPGEDAVSVRFLGMMVDYATLNSVAESLGARAPVEFISESRPVDADVRILMHLFTEEARNRQAGSELVLEGLSTQLIVRMLRGLGSNIPATPPVVNRIDRKGIARAAEFLRENYTREYSLADVARVAEMSPYHFIRVFKAQVGKSPHEFLIDVKIDHACKQLRQSGLRVTDICYGCGFSNPSHFATVFKRKIGVSPSEYRRMTTT